MKKYFIGFFVLFLYALLNTHSSVSYTRPLTIDDYISKYSFEYKVPEKLIREVLRRESGVSCNPKGHQDGGKAKGPAQFHKPTFDRFAKEKGEILDYNSCHDQVKLMAWAFSQGENYRRHWSTYRAITKA